MSDPVVQITKNGEWSDLVSSEALASAARSFYLYTPRTIPLVINGMGLRLKPVELQLLIRVPQHRLVTWKRVPQNQNGKEELEVLTRKIGPVTVGGNTYMWGIPDD